MGAWVLAPGFVESRDVKLFAGDPLEAWQKNYSFKSLLALVDRDGTTTKDVVNAVYARIQANGGGFSSQADYDQAMRTLSLGQDSPEKYMGIVVLLVIAVTMLWNERRANRRAFWFFVASLLTSVLFATGLSSVWSANTTTWDELSSLHVSGVVLL